MRDEDDLLEPQLGDDGIEVADLIGCGVGVSGGFVRCSPPEKIEGDDSTRGEIRNQTIVEVKVVREPVHQNDRRFLSRVFPDVDAMAIPLYESLAVDHRASDHLSFESR